MPVAGPQGWLASKKNLAGAQNRFACALNVTHVEGIVTTEMKGSHRVVRTIPLVCLLEDAVARSRWVPNVRKNKK